MPSAAVLDAQGTRGSPQGGPSGYDAGKKVKGRKRNLVVDTLGLVLAVSVCAANLTVTRVPMPWPALLTIILPCNACTSTVLTPDNGRPLPKRNTA